MPRPGEDRSDVGGAAQFNNIGPVPLSPTVPLSPSNIGPGPSRFPNTAKLLKTRRIRIDYLDRSHPLPRSM